METDNRKRKSVQPPLLTQYRGAKNSRGYAAMAAARAGKMNEVAKAPPISTPPVASLFTPRKATPTPLTHKEESNTHQYKSQDATKSTQDQSPDRKSKVCSPAAKNLLGAFDGSIARSGPRPTPPIQLNQTKGTSTNLESDFQYQGLPNLGNTCYINAIIQVLSNLEPLVEDVLSIGRASSPPAQSLLQALVVAFSDKKKKWSSTPPSAVLPVVGRYRISLPSPPPSHSSSSSFANSPAEIKKAIQYSKPRFSGSQQQDAHEFLCSLLELLEDDFRRLHSPTPPSSCSPTTPVTKPLLDTPQGLTPQQGLAKCPVELNFNSILQRELTCMNCSRVSKTNAVFTHLSLNLPANTSLPENINPNPNSVSNFFKSSDSQLDIGKLLAEYFEKEILEHCCEKCGERNCCATSGFARLPRVLILHLNRFQYNPNPNANELNSQSFSTVKRCDRVRFPRELSLDSYTVQNVEEAPKFERPKAIELPTQNEPLYARSSIPKSAQTSMNPPRPKSQLASFLMKTPRPSTSPSSILPTAILPTPAMITTTPSPPTAKASPAFTEPSSLSNVGSSITEEPRVPHKHIPIPVSARTSLRDSLQHEDLATTPPTPPATGGFERQCSPPPPPVVYSRQKRGPAGPARNLSLDSSEALARRSLLNQRDIQRNFPGLHMEQHSAEDEEDRMLQMALRASLKEQNMSSTNEPENITMPGSELGNSILIDDEVEVHPKGGLVLSEQEQIDQAIALSLLECNPDELGASRSSDTDTFPNKPVSQELINERGKHQYQLQGVISHLGRNMHSGHFIADIFDSTGNCWMRHDDATVSKAADVDFITPRLESEAYMLVYVWKDCKDTTVGSN